MRVLLDQEDIQKALTAYLGTLNIPNACGVELSMKDSDIQGEIIAEVSFYSTSGELKGDTKPVEEEKPKRRGRGGRPAGSKNKPKTQPEENADVDAPVQDSADISSTGDTEATEVEAPVSTETETPKPKGTKKGNLFGDKESPSSEDDGAAEAALDIPPVEDEKPKKGSIFDS